MIANSRHTDHEMNIRSTKYIPIHITEPLVTINRVNSRERMSNFDGQINVNFEKETANLNIHNANVSTRNLGSEKSQKSVAASRRSIRHNNRSNRNMRKSVKPAMTSRDSNRGAENKLRSSKPQTNLEHAIEIRMSKDTKGDFYWKLNTVSKRVKEFVELLGSKYDIQWINRHHFGSEGHLK